MIVLRLELHSARTGKVTPLGMMIIANDGKHVGGTIHDYDVYLGDEVTHEAFLARKTQSIHQALTRPVRRARVERHAAKARSVWSLVARALKALRFE